MWYKVESHRKKGKITPQQNKQFNQTRKCKVPSEICSIHTSYLCKPISAGLVHIDAWVKMMGKNKDQGVRKMVKIVINEPRTTRKGLQKASLTPHPQDIGGKRTSIEALVVECITYCFLCNTVHAASRSFRRPFQVELGSLITVLTIFLVFVSYLNAW